MPALRVKLMNLIKSGTSRRCYIDFAANDGLDPLRLAGAVEIDRTVHDTVVRNGTGSLSHVFDDFGQVLDSAGTIQQAVFRMNM